MKLKIVITCIASLVLAAGCALSPASESTSTQSSALGTCDLSQLSGIFTSTPWSAADGGTCPAVNAVGASNLYNRLVSGTACTSHGVTVSADGCTVDWTCQYLGAPSGLPAGFGSGTLVDEQFAMAQTYAPDLSSFTASVSATGISETGCAGNWTFSGSK